ncbi:hypothetical protein PQ469_08705 [Mucilaginibacter sp. KACC 22773]|uniref:hypothetical protein n=1 Tax=Mucilaginibacter sp. KACC 22773 TaxID=3025671 RepID=UPI0023664050|nr:hypothetical protein [Mucilaginibacter sp. KACC 22773]WDF80083.1 hypothetical protein PQ469_08705 [Mucilaginibacter sp. KACC 22773]
MKRYLITLIIFCSLFNQVWGQSPTAAIDSLIKYRIITVKQRPVLNKEISRHKGYASSRVAILWGLQSIILQKIFHISSHKVGSVFVSYRNTFVNKTSQDSINTSLRLLLNNIRKAGLLTDKVYTRTLKSIDSNSYLMDVQMVGSLAEMSSRLEWLTPGKLLPVAEQLHKTGIVSDSSFTQLQNDIKNGVIESGNELNRYCKRGKTLDLKKYPDEPHLWMEQLHRDISSVMPGLNFTNFSYTTTRDTDRTSMPEGIPEIKFKVSLTCNGRIYKYTSDTFDYGARQAKLQPEEIFVKLFFRIFNKVLADQQSPFRLHNIMFSDGSFAEDNLRYLAVIALTGDQAEIFMNNPCMRYMMVSMDSYDNTLTSGRVDSTIAEWKKIGLFAHLSQLEIEKAVDDAKADNWFSINNLLSNFPHVLYPLHTASMEPRTPYTSILNHFAEITHGAFNPTGITEKKVTGGYKLQYVFKGKTHSYTFHTKYGWPDTQFTLLMKSLGRDNNLPGNFYQLKYEDTVIYLTDEQHIYAVKNNLLNFDATTP